MSFRASVTFLQVLFGGLALLLPPNAPAEERKADARSDPHWEGFRNRLLPTTTRGTRQDFGLRTTNQIGGWVQRSTMPAWFARVIPAQTLKDELDASGKFTVTRTDGSSGVLFGWFNEDSRDWRTPNSLAFRLDGNGGKYWVFFEYGTHNWLTGGTGCFERKQYQTTRTKPFPADGAVHEWTLHYLPRAASGQGEMRFVLDGKEYVCPLAPGHKSDGATFNRFGVFNHQTTGKGMEVCFSELSLQGKPLEQDAHWEGKATMLSSKNASSGHCTISDTPRRAPRTVARVELEASSGAMSDPPILRTGLAASPWATSFPLRANSHYARPRLTAVSISAGSTRRPRPIK